MAMPVVDSAMVDARLPGANPANCPARADVVFLFCEYTQKGLRHAHAVWIFNPWQEAGMKWVTRSHVHVDRVACPWLISRFVDSEAQFVFVPKNEIGRVVEETGAIPFDAPGFELGHHAGQCSFEAILAKYELKDPGLLRLAQIVHAADVAEDIDLDPLARGLEALATGYSLRFPDDLENLERQFEVYDSLYAWCRLQVARK